MNVLDDLKFLAEQLDKISDQSLIHIQRLETELASVGVETSIGVSPNTTIGYKRFALGFHIYLCREGKYRPYSNLNRGDKVIVVHEIGRLIEKMKHEAEKLLETHRELGER